MTKTEMRRRVIEKQSENSSRVHTKNTTDRERRVIAIDLSNSDPKQHERDAR
jgi:hypothetical protein